jgi:signal transduction histidine kinase
MYSELNQQSDSNVRQLRRHSAIEQGRFNALDLLVKGRPLNEVLEQSTEGLKCGIMLLDRDKRSLSPLSMPSFPSEFCDQFINFPIASNTGSCGAAAYHLEPFITEDIDKHPNWIDYREDSLKYNVRSCWSYPIVSPAGELMGTFSMYFPQSRLPDQDDLDSLQYEARIISVILERAGNIDKLQELNVTLEKRVADRTKELMDANVLLKKALEQRNEVQTQLVEMENMAALGTMMSSLTHEINTPAGVAITAISHLRTIQQEYNQRYIDGNLKRSDLDKFFLESIESSEIVERNLVRSTQLIKTFKQLSIDQHSQDTRTINLCGYMDEILLSLKPRLKRAKHLFCIDIDADLEIISNPGAISQLLINLIMNSSQHAFSKDQVGHILIRAKLADAGKSLELTYKDNGRGMSHNTIENLYKPFFTLARSQGGSGLGMHICYNLVVKILRGHIDCQSSINKGVTFNINFPIAQ